MSAGMGKSNGTPVLDEELQAINNCWEGMTPSQDKLPKLLIQYQVVVLKAYTYKQH